MSRYQDTCIVQVGWRGEQLCLCTQLSLIGCPHRVNGERVSVGFANQSSGQFAEKSKRYSIHCTIGS